MFIFQQYLQKYLLILLIFISLLYSQNTNAVELAKHLSTITKPIPIDHISPSYPIKAAKQGREGWVILSFVITEKGFVSDVIIKETSGSQDFAEKAQSAVLKWRYKPAFENGKAIQQCVNTIQIDFRISSAKNTVSRRFKTTYNHAQQALKNKDFEQVEALLKKMVSISKNKMRLSENNYMHLLAADYAKATNNKELQLFHLTRAVPANQNNQKLVILYEKLFLQVDLKQYQEAHDTYKKIIKLDEAKPYIAQLNKLVQQLENIISSEQNLILPATIKADNFWSVALVRNNFSLINIKGKIDKLDIRCANKRHIYSFEENNTWTLPSSWKNCSLYVFGEENTTFNVIEKPIKS